VTEFPVKVEFAKRTEEPSTVALPLGSNQIFTDKTPLLFPVCVPGELRMTWLNVTLSPLRLTTFNSITATFTLPANWVELGGLLVPAAITTSGWVGV